METGASELAIAESVALRDVGLPRLLLECLRRMSAAPYLRRSSALVLNALHGFVGPDVQMGLRQVHSRW